MARRLYTVADIAESVRSRIDEMNRDSIDTERDILPALNRALEYATDIYAKNYPDPYIASTTIPLVTGQAEYDIPEDVYEDRLVKVDLYVTSSGYSEILRISYKDLANYQSNALTSNPYYYAITGRKLIIVPAPASSANNSLRLWYVKNPEQLVLPQGRVTLVNETSQYLVLNDIGESLTSESDELNSYINVINFRTGEIKGTFQIGRIEDARIYIRTTPSRDSVLGRDINISLADLSIARDDYVCLSTGTCVPYLASPTTNFLIQFAISELSRQLGVNSVEEEQVLAKFEKQVQDTWAGREPTYRIAKRNPSFGLPVRRWTLTQKGN